MSDSSDITGELIEEIYIKWTSLSSSLLPEETDEYIESPEFSFKNTKWRFVLYPNGEHAKQSGGWVGLYIRVGYTLAPEYTVKVKVGIEKGKKTILYKGYMTSGKRGTLWGTSKLMKSGEIRNESDSIDELTVFYRIYSRENKRKAKKFANVASQAKVIQNSIMLRLSLGALLLTCLAAVHASGDWEPSHYEDEWKAQPIKYIIKENPKLITIPHHVPVPKPVHIPKHVPVIKHIPVPKPYPVPHVVPVIKHIHKEIPVPKIINIHKEVPVPKPYPIPKVIRVPKPYVVPVHKEIPVPKPYPVHVPVHIPKPYIVPVHKHVPVPVPKPVHVPIEVIKEKSVIIKKPVPVYLEEKHHHHHGWDK